jgi:heparosan-N-sulfate-glucuronate 5-epimerase
LSKSYETYGDFVKTTNGESEFEISQSYSKVYSPREKYDPGGQYMHFKQFDVESRSRVKCVTPSEGVPISTQWDPEGYFYPTQIAQYALSHYSMHVSGVAKSKTFLEDGGDYQAEWIGGRVQRVDDDESNNLVVEFSSKVRLNIDSPQLILCLDLKSIDAVSLTIYVNSSEDNTQYKLTYTADSQYLRTDGGEVVFGFGDKTNQWLRLTRDVYNDIKKSQIGMKKTIKVKKSSLRISVLELQGVGRVTNISVSDQEHLRMFFHGADWFLNNQDDSGGWPSDVVFNKHRKKYPEAEEIGRGWYGAMCQGQAISVLCRAYVASGDKDYLSAASAALDLFEVSSSEGGVRAEFLGQFPWYEEYPTQPSTFILNGFMYSLLGLYDLANTEHNNTRARDLFDRGMESLKALLPFYDSGAGTFYDLRHFTMKTAPKGARWDYHATHVNQLLTLSTLDDDQQLLQTAERWRGYMIGKRAPHN